MAIYIELECTHVPSGAIVTIMPPQALWDRAQNGHGGSQMSIAAYYARTNLAKTYPKLTFQFVDWADLSFKIKPTVVTSPPTAKPTVSVGGNPDCRCDDPKATRCPIHDR
jgi:hypothetical protein